METLTAALPSFVWDQVEPNHPCEQGERPPQSCYCKRLKADLLPGTFVMIATTNDGGTCTGDAIARILTAVGSFPSFAVDVNIFKRISEVITGSGEDILMPQPVSENHLKHLPEIVQTTEVMAVSITDITNLAFVFKEASLQEDASNFFFTCQGMSLAFLLRFRVSPRDCSDQNNKGVLLDKIPLGHCLPFPSCYEDSKYYDCFARRIWNNIVLVKLEIMKLLGRYSQQQGLYGRECSRLYFTAETWGFICLQCSNIFSGSDFGLSKRVRLHRIVQSGLVVKAARVQKTCAVMRFSMKSELKGLSQVFGESVTAGQRCRLPKISAPKSLWINDVINVVCGSDVRETEFSSRTARDGIDLEFDGLNELFLTIRYTRYPYTRTSLGLTEQCDPLLSSLICHVNPYIYNNCELSEEMIHQASIDDNEHVTIIHDSEFEDDGCLYRVRSMNSTHVVATCIYPKRNNAMHGCTKLFDLAVAKELVRHRLSG